MHLDKMGFGERPGDVHRRRDLDRLGELDGLLGLDGDPELLADESDRLRA